MASTEITFSRRIKSELALNSNYSDEEKKAILSGFVRYSGSVSISPSLSINMQSSIASVAKFIFNLFKEIYDVKPHFTYEKQLRLNKKIIYNIVVDEKVDMILKDLEIIEGFDRLKLHEMIKKSYFRGFIVGTFLASGQISDPSKGRYFCEMVFNEEADAKATLNKLLLFKDDEEMSFKMTERRNKYVLYLKKGDQISVFLQFLGAISMMLEFENERLTRDFFNNENRLIICSNANYSRSLKTGEKNLADIKIIEDKVGLIYFEDKVKELVKLRKEHNDASYQELADLAVSKGIQVTKSGVVHIFAKLAKDAEKLKNEEPQE